MRRPWTWPGPEAEREGRKLTSRYRMPRPVAATLARRGFTEGTLLEAFLNPRLGGLGDPASLDDIERGAERVWNAIDNREPIFVHGDYDVDGITGTAFLARTLRVLGADVVPYVPRREDGYGLGEAGIEAAREAGARVLITVDNGIQAFDAVEDAAAAGLDVVILDHHPPGERLPDALAVVNPRRSGEGPFRNLSGVGVAAKFMHAVGKARPGKLPHDAYKEALQLVALGTIADVVPLTGENRILVSHGLRRLGRSRFPGMRALMARAGIRPPRVSSSDVAFFLAPRLNAAGRMGEAQEALELLLADDPAEAYRLADRLEVLNVARRKADQRVLEELAAQVASRKEIPPALVLWSDTWPAGVIGIAAGRALERYHRPSFLVAVDGEIGRGSARSGPGFALPPALEAAADLLATYGGHAQAAGFTVARENLPALRDRIEAYAREAGPEPEPEPMEVDAAVDLGEMDLGCVQWLDRLSPFGQGNPEPLFGAEGVTVVEEPTVVGKDHLRLTLGSGTRRCRAIAFGMASRGKELSRGRRVDALFHAAFDPWRGPEATQLVIRDLKTRGA